MQLLRPKRFLPLLAAIVGIALLCSGGASAGTSGTEIEGVWTFNGGQIAVQHLSNGTYAGTVVKATTFASCSHPVGQQIWTAMEAKQDGSFWGLHQWYLADCKTNPSLGPTAWRILEGSGKSHYLRVCFSHPGDPQPEIAANGDPKDESEYATYHVTFGCTNSALIAPLPVTSEESKGSGSSGSSGSGKNGVSPTVESLTLPSTKRCLRKVKRFNIRLKDPKYDPLKTVTVVYKGHKIAVKREGHSMVATINLKHLRGGSFTVTIHAVTVLGHKLSARRTYHFCTKHKKHRGHKKG
jgi:hypothetical protein